MYKSTVSEKKEFWIIFKRGVGWYQRYLKDGFGHCVLLFKDDFNWIILDPTIFCLETIILPHDLSENIPKIYSNKDRFSVLKIEVSLDKSKKTNKLITIPSCTTAICYIMGVRMFALTPHMLYKKLILMASGRGRSIRRRIKSNIDSVKIIY